MTPNGSEEDRFLRVQVYDTHKGTVGPKGLIEQAEATLKRLRQTIKVYEKEDLP